MKKLIILLIISISFLSGCGICNLNNFVLPDDAEFLALVQELNTLEKIYQYMADNFTTEEHPYISLTPYQLYTIRKGDCNDFATFAQFAAHHHGIEAYLALIQLDVRHAIAIFKEDNCYTFGELQWYNPDDKCHNSFSEIIQIWYSWSSYTVYDYDMNIVEQYIKQSIHLPKHFRYKS